MPHHKLKRKATKKQPSTEIQRKAVSSGAGGTRTRTILLSADFPATLCCHSRISRCSLDYVFALSCDLGSGYIVSTHLQLISIGLARRYPGGAFAGLAHIHTRCFLSWCSAPGFSCCPVSKSAVAAIPPQPHMHAYDYTTDT